MCICDKLSIIQLKVVAINKVNYPYMLLHSTNRNISKMTTIDTFQMLCDLWKLG